MRFNILTALRLVLDESINNLHLWQKSDYISTAPEISFDFLPLLSFNRDLKICQHFFG